jgi:hypothetical protein
MKRDEKRRKREGKEKEKEKTYLYKKFRCLSGARVRWYAEHTRESELQETISSNSAYSLMNTILKFN